VKDIHIYFEGDALLRPGFRKFFSKVIESARKQNHAVLPIATNGTPIRDFGIAQRKDASSINLLLLDSEQQLDGTALRQQQAVGFPADRIFWMVELMESWFLADREAVKRYYDDDRFQESSLPANAQVERIPKKDVIDGLKEATRRTQKGRYHKTKHAPGILETIDPDKVAKSAPQCRRLFDVLNGLLADGEPG
jgi:hypothetical protein